MSTKSSFYRLPVSSAPIIWRSRLKAFLFITAIFFTFHIIYIIPKLDSIASPTPDVAHILNHLRILDRIDNDHDGNRAANTSGYEAGARYLTKLLRKENACDSLERQYFTAPLFKQTGPSNASLASEGASSSIALQEGHDFAIIHGPSGSFSGGSVVWLEDFGCPFVKQPSLVVEGKVVAINRSSLSFLGGSTLRDCSMNDLAHAAYGKGALALIVANSQSDNLLWPLLGTLDVPWRDGANEMPKIPIVSVDWVVGQFLRRNHSLSLSTHTEVKVVETFNILCTWELSSSLSSQPETLLVGAHFDSVPTGPGIVDNGSGSMAILEWLTAIRKHTAQSSPPSLAANVLRAVGLGQQSLVLPMERRIVWAWWGAEELGLIGSQYYASQLAAGGSLSGENVVAAINVDMIASPNGIPRVVNASSAPLKKVVSPSRKIQKRLEYEFYKFREEYELMDSGMMTSDEWSFWESGIPAGSLQNGAGKIKTQSQRMLFGGMAGAPMDPCLHSACDTFENVNVRLLKLMSQVGFRTVMQLASRADLKAWLWDGRDDY